MASEWFYNVDGKKHGPVSSPQLQALAKSGKLKPTDNVMKAGSEKWIPASTVKGLFPSSAGAVTAKKPQVAASNPSSSDRGQPKARATSLEDENSTASDEQRKPSQQRVGRGKAAIALISVAAVACVACLGGVIVLGAVLFQKSGTSDKTLAENKEKQPTVQVVEEKKGIPTEQPKGRPEVLQGKSGIAERPIAKRPEEKKIQEEMTNQVKGDIGGVIRERLVNAKAKSGDVQVSLFWQSKDDLDLHVIAPSGEEIYFGNRISRCRGELDVDMNADYNSAVIGAVENIYWPTGKAPLGKYKVYVHHFSHHGGLPGTMNPVPFSVRVVHQGESQLFFGRVARPARITGQFEGLAL